VLEDLVSVQVVHAARLAKGAAAVVVELLQIVNERLGTSEYFALNVFLCDGEHVFLNYTTRGRGVEALGSLDEVEP
jgi:hypothetical protein